MAYFYLRSALLCTIMVVTVGCASSDHTQQHIDKSIQQAGGNATELLSVLQHYADDNEKLEAARFIIANMHGCNGLGGIFMDSLEANFKALQHVNSTPHIDVEFKERWKSDYQYQLDSIDECTTVTAGYLISNIDHAYSRWKNKPWNKDVDFKHFCELLLPYKIEDEITTDWRELYSNRYEHLLDSAYGGDDPVEACRHLKKIIYEHRTHTLINEFSYPHRQATDLFDCSVGNCRDECDFIAYAMRACGIPVITDFYTASPDNFLSHCWSVVYDWKTDSYIPFSETDPRRDNPEWDGRKKGKVYRSLWRMTAGEKIPAGADTDCKVVADVTNQYFGDNLVEIPLKGDRSDKVMLGINCRLGWKPIDVGKIKGNKAVFNNIEPGVIYCAIDKSGRAISDPFVYEADKSVTILSPDTKTTHCIEINRKWPVSVMLRREWLSEDHIGGYFTAYTPDGKCDTIHTITDTLASNYNIIPLNPSRHYTHIRYTAPAGKRVTIAEISFLRDRASTDTIGYSARTLQTDDQSGITAMNDGDIITYYKSPAGTNAVTFSFNHHECPDHICFIPRNDDNYVWPGQEFELLYYDANRQWQSLGKQVATGHSLIYENVPNGALLLLRNHSKGKAEQAFIWRNNQQIFSIDL